jgi:hypothetical protein
MEQRPPRRRDSRPSRDRDQGRGRDRGRGRRPERQPPSGAYEKRAAKNVVPITKAMEEGKEMLRSFGDLLQFQQKKKERKDSPPPAEHNAANSADTNSNGVTETFLDPKVEGHQPEST